MLIGVLGHKFSGKDTTANYLIKKYNFKRIAFADPLKEACRILFNFDDDQLYGDKKEIIDQRWGIMPRTAFQYLGTDIFRNKINEIIPNIESSFWVKLCMDNYEKNKKLDYNVVISDVRFQNEINAIREKNGIIIKIIRPNLQVNDNHASENISELNGDYEIYNDGSLEDLYGKIDKILENIIT
ncbi:deoxynucleoside monophosphate kinase [Indivirus ILV1]|uniref:Deoxynucleoside monophosphate kinase n=1 Tax=Indivirus ILV1 TaxID=1977633 RepID=A0A1V0SD59_9VIRU|nr:deoxynucleoside monophosphate kinase [Indivirus ILV1]